MEFKIGNSFRVVIKNLLSKYKDCYYLELEENTILTIKDIEKEKYEILVSLFGKKEIKENIILCLKIENSPLMLRFYDFELVDMIENKEIVK